ncbi:translation initiation factor eIF-2B subunit alpha isoform X2 [Harpia harpyja]|uniref:translation initiation factor eIF-2B subunit alpha isoform X2 n=1 Tax=Harpia harpyja TaxID=202280 RepID=UPI0022B0F542|nr:translation initiation factor eIF-2B subunit alpha isoform X2 [Harpia harpyja]
MTPRHGATSSRRVPSLGRRHAQARRAVWRPGGEGSGAAAAMSTDDLIETFRAQLRDDPDVASAVVAIRVLLGFLKQDRGETIQGLRSSLLAAIDTLSRVDSSVAVSSGGELFLRFISLTSLEYSDYSKCKEIMIERGEIFLRKVSLSRNKIAKLCHPFIRDGAAKNGKSSEEAEHSCDCDSGCCSWIGTNQIAVCAKAQNKPFYVVAESFKFVRLFPLNQQDVPDKFKYKADTLKTSQNLTEEHPWIDYTSPSLITLLFTDLGVLTPSAVSDELIKLYL